MSLEEQQSRPEDAHEQKPTGSEQVPVEEDDFHAIFEAIGRRTDKRMRVVLAQERIELLKRLEFRELVLDPRNPEASARVLGEIERVYTENLIPDAALVKLDEGDIAAFEKAVERGGMLNRFQPSPVEVAEYPGGYETVRDQVTRDMLEHTQQGGTYRVFSLIAPDGKVCAYVSMLVPPQDDESCQKYALNLQHMLVGETKKPPLYNNKGVVTRPGKYCLTHDKRSMVYRPGWDIDRMVDYQLQNWGEIDTINVSKGFGGASMLLLYRSMLQIEQERGKLPEAFFCYRSEGIVPASSHAEFAGQRIPIGENPASAELFERRLKFKRMADKSDPDERVIRQIADGSIHLYNPDWVYLYSSSDNMMQRLERQLQELGLI